jgi:hypothetical protein
LFCVGPFYPTGEGDATAFEDYLCGEHATRPLLVDGSPPCLPDLLSSFCSSLITLLISGAKEVPLPTYFIEGPPAAAEKKYGAIQGGCDP